ncbi:hypothetical protein HN51_063882 [Arachis hypogaea]|uniref:putative ubiquitin-conjugating enzyme E2 38 n=1 Tax=Arachis ipaensis TaxID=130454 RepID=UPI0007AFD614|nr:putative ubiquitin-conjugating enzyme E2 38 [Arachis ipaensis]XP_025630221.1 putative ubiquitin-conjugating enzyme E2 38 [Arachis hypogaea]QHO21481.1 Putative ubiquitin-conjugating enzyme E2 [Arachis hypogaea]
MSSSHHKQKEAANTMKGREQIFKVFDIVSEVPDDHFFGSPSKESSSYSTANSNLSKCAMKEWKILEQNLPDSIYIRVYENRIDLMRAVIIGAAGTPYHDGLFFFDIKLPSKYPNYPPELYFHSFGHRLNPNLYSSGRVCLSLLNTWHGRTAEKWDPRASTLLQVLLSIQALVLNEQPFFNEPGTSYGRPIFQSRSRVYTEMAFQLTWEVAMNLVRRPPEHFEAFVLQHFSTRSVAVLDACREYANERVWVGYYCRNQGGDGRSSSLCSSSNVKVSASFKKSLVEILYPRLVQTFQSCGADLKGTPKELESEVIINKQPKRKQMIDPTKHENKGEVGKHNNKGGIFMKAVDRIKTALGWKKKKTDSKQF